MARRIRKTALWKSRIAGKKQPYVSRWHGEEEARRAVCDNRARLRSGVAREAFGLRAEPAERSFALVLDRGGMRRAWLRGRQNLRKRRLVHVAGYDPGPIVRLPVGAGTPRRFLAGASAQLLALATADGAIIVVLAIARHGEAAMLAVSFEPEPGDRSRDSSTRCYEPLIPGLSLARTGSRYTETDEFFVAIIPLT